MTTPSGITMVHSTIADCDGACSLVVIRADRWQLAKLRWRATAEDGRDFGFELDTPLQHGDAVLLENQTCYVIDQTSEPTLVVKLPSASEAAALGWAIGNLHLPLEIAGDRVITPDDPALHALFQQRGIAYQSAPRVFHPLRAAAGHHHHHHHDHP